MGSASSRIHPSTVCPSICTARHLCHPLRHVEACLGQVQVTQGRQSSPKEPEGPACSLQPRPRSAPTRLHLPDSQCQALPLGPDPAGVNARNHSYSPSRGVCWGTCPGISSGVLLAGEGSIKGQPASGNPYAWPDKISRTSQISCPGNWY